MATSASLRILRCRPELRRLVCTLSPISVSVPIGHSVFTLVARLYFLLGPCFPRIKGGYLAVYFVRTSEPWCGVSLFPLVNNLGDHDPQASDKSSVVSEM